MKISDFKVKPDSKVDLSKIDTSNSEGIKTKGEAKKLLKKNVEKMMGLQDKLYSEDRYSMLLIFQALDAAGKDGTIKHVMSGLNPQGTQVTSFKQPSAEELNHHYLWRVNDGLPERGRIGIFNRSYYEEVLVVRVHNLLAIEKIPAELINENIWQTRFREINDFEKNLYENGTIILKFFLHLSKDEQKHRFLERIDTPSKNWKFSETDLKERDFWDDYQKCFAEAIAATSKKYAPWFIIPADIKWFARLSVSSIIIDTMEKLNLQYPKLNKQQLDNLKICQKKLEKE
ncbi:MAG: polyphosphate kinase 2 family protein [Ignavibacteriaceae bacterium]